ncbi:MAG: GAF domain-containing protein [Anaerolineae bacterium]|nr:GAF domain-containing protein [Anaerolineae bacterium]
MNHSKAVLDDLLALSMQLNRQAFAQPPVEGWLNSFLAVICERFAVYGVLGVQISQIVGNIAMRVAGAGQIPTENATQPVDDSSPLLLAIRRRQIATTPNARIYPITIGSDAIGAIVAYHTPTHGAPSTLETLDALLTTLANQLGPALLQHLKKPGPQTGRLLRQIDVMRSLYEVTRDFTSATESHEVLDRAARSLVETLRIDHIGIVVFDQDENAGTVIAEFPDHGMIGLRIPLDTPLEEHLLKTKAPVVVNNVDADPMLGDSERALLQQLGIKSIALLPMIVKGRLIGSLGLDSFYDYHTFTTDEIEAAAAVTSQLAITAHNAQLYEEIKRHATQLEHITALSRRITSTFDRMHIFQIIREETPKLIAADLISVALISPNGETLNIYLLVDSGPLLASFPLERAALRFVFNTGEPLVLDDISGSDEPDYRLFASSRLRAIASVPLIAGGKTTGVFSVLHREAGRYMSVDIAVLEQIGYQLAIALENARLYMQTAQRAETERLMNRLSGALQGQSDLRGMLLNTLQEIAEALSARRARVRLEVNKRSSYTGSD